VTGLSRLKEFLCHVNQTLEFVNERTEKMRRDNISSVRRQTLVYTCMGGFLLTVLV